jgi:phage/plasmid-like protein (TIGR03299 family)
MAYANEVPWHGLGGRVDSNVTVEEMLVAAGLDWNVDLRPLTANWVDAAGAVHSVKVKDRYALIRSSDNRVLTVTGKSWKPVQNAATLGFMREYVEAGGATLETAGSLRRGKIVWALAKLAHSFSVSRGDKVEGYLLFTSPHEVGRAMQIRTTSVRVVCANTMAMAMGASELNYSQNHLTEFNIEAAKAVVGNAHETLAQAEKRAKTLHKLKIGLEDAVRKVLVPAFYGEVLPEETMADIMITEAQPKTLQAMINSINTAPGAEPETGWGVLNGVTHWADHIAGHNNETRMYRSWMGDYSRKKLEVEEKLLALA